MAYVRCEKEIGRSSIRIFPGWALQVLHAQWLLKQRFISISRPWILQFKRMFPLSLRSFAYPHAVCLLYANVKKIFRDFVNFFHLFFYITLWSLRIYLTITFFSTVAICNINYDYDMNLLALHFFFTKTIGTEYTNMAAISWFWLVNMKSRYTMVFIASFFHGWIFAKN